MPPARPAAAEAAESSGTSWCILGDGQWQAAISFSSLVVVSNSPSLVRVNVIQWALGSHGACLRAALAQEGALGEQRRR